jgi:HTH-type transcriptional regulator/antitoxin HigA
MAEIDVSITFSPNYAVHPGQTLIDVMTLQGITQAELATRIGRPLKTINEIIKGKASITPDTALQLDRALNVDARVWNALEAHYQLVLAEKREASRLLSYNDWMKRLPLAEMRKRGILPQGQRNIELVKSALRFFGVDSPESLAHSSTVAAFRKSPTFDADDLALHTWLRIGERAGQALKCDPFDKIRFKTTLSEARKLSTEDDLQRVRTRLVEMCSAAGVAVMFVAPLQQTPVSGAARWLNSEKALIQLTCRHKTDDHVWFTFFHEAAHILLHGKREGFLDNTVEDHEVIEREANSFAANALIPIAAMNEFARQKPITKNLILGFASEMGVSPGIVVGQLQARKRLPMVTILNTLKRSGYDLTDV